MSVSTTLVLTLSATPRRLIPITTAMNAMAMNMMAVFETSQPKPAARFDANARDAVEAEVMPELITANATMNVKKCTPNARCT
jgi:hypothetical protein